jgi:hypothetical protein
MMAKIIRKRGSAPMLDFGIFGKLKSAAPYAVILYLLCGGSGNIKELAGFDTQAATYTLGQVENRTAANGMREFYFEYFPNGLPGVNEHYGMNLPQGSMGTFMRNAVQYPMSILRGGYGQTDYGY